MKRNKVLCHLIALIVTISMVFTLGMPVLAAPTDHGELALGTSTTINSDTFGYYLLHLRLQGHMP